MRDQAGGVVFPSWIERKKVSMKLGESSEMPRRRPGIGGEGNFENGGARLSEGGMEELNGGSLMQSSSNGGKGERSSPASRDEGLLPQWGRGKRSRGSRPDKHTPSPSPSPSSPPDTQLLNGLASSSNKLRSQASSKPPSSNFNANPSDHPVPVVVSGNNLMHKPVNGSGHTNGFASARQIPNGKERAASFQKRSIDCSFGRQQQRTDVSDLAKPSWLNNCAENIVGVCHTTNGAGTMSDVNGLECNKPKVEWPRIGLTLSRREKEEDFLIIKGSKLPQRPRKRLKVVEKALLFCSPGNWLNDISRGRYDVREKKSTKKKPGGLKAMDSADSDSE